MSSQERFEAASSWLPSATAAESLPNDVKLELYGLFKFIHAADGPTGSRPGIFSFEGRAKYDSWARVAAEYCDREDDARIRYVQIAESVGWSEGAVGSVPHDLHATTKSSTGLGPSVSVMTQEPEADGSSSPIHDAAADGLLNELKIILSKDRHLINDKDEFGYTPLHLAADRGQIDIVAYLLSMRADTTVLDPDGQTALDLAKVSDRQEIIKLLE